MSRGVTVLGLAAFAATLYAFVIPDAPLFREPSLARIIFFHLPAALVASALIPVAAYAGFQFLKKREVIWDARCAAATETGALFATLTMVTGILFSRVQWGEWWHWDARQSSFLVVLLLFAAALSLRGGIADTDRRASVGAGYSLAMLLPALFLIFVLPRIPPFAETSFHPNQTITGGMLKGEYGYGVLANLAVYGALAWALVRYRVRAAMLEHRVEELEYGYRETGGGDTAAPRVVRRVAVPSDDRQPDVEGRAAPR